MPLTIAQLQTRLRTLADDIQMSGLYGHARRARAIATQLGNAKRKGRTKHITEMTTREIMDANTAYFRKNGHW